MKAKIFRIQPTTVTISSGATLIPEFLEYY